MIKSRIDLPVIVCHSNAGYYIGQLYEDGEPYSRLSGYYRSEADALAGLSCFVGGRSDNIYLELDLVQAGILEEIGVNVYSVKQ